MKDSTLHILMDSDLKHQFAQVCRDNGVSMTEAITIFIETMLRHGDFPFDPSPYLEDTTAN